MLKKILIGLAVCVVLVLLLIVPFVVSLYKDTVEFMELYGELSLDMPIDEAWKVFGRQPDRQWAPMSDSTLYMASWHHSVSGSENVQYMITIYGEEMDRKITALAVFGPMGDGLGEGFLVFRDENGLVLGYSYAFPIEMMQVPEVLSANTLLVTALPDDFDFTELGFADVRKPVIK